MSARRIWLAPWWPPQPQEAPPPKPAPEPIDDPLEGRRLEELPIDDLKNLMGSLAQEALRNGMLALGQYARLPSVLGEGLQLAVDGTKPHLIEDILRTRTDTTIRNRRIRLSQMLEGVVSLMAGDNPWIVLHKLGVFFLEYGAQRTPERVLEDVTAPQVIEWLQKDPVQSLSFGQIADLFLHLAFLARREGGHALREVVVHIDEPILQEALGSAVANRVDPDAVRSAAQSAIDEDLRQLEISLRAATAGILAIVAGKKPEEVAHAVGVAAADAIGEDQPA